MRTSIKFENKLIMKAQMENHSTFQVLEFDKLTGASDEQTAMAIDAINRVGTRLRQVRIILENSAVKLEPGAVSYMKGVVEKKDTLNKALSKGKKIISSKFSSEVSEYRPIYEGEGEIFLEPSFQHYALIELEDEDIIVDDNLFLACEDTVEVKSVINGRKYETLLSGSGIVVVELPVPSEEIFRCKLYNDFLKVDGDFAVLRSGNIDYYTESSSAVSGNGMINVYNGIGDVWLLPTKGIYSDIKVNNRDFVADNEEF